MSFPLNQKNVIYFGYARTALEYGYHFLGLKNGDEILYPDYICDVCALSAKKLGIKIKYYEVTDTLEPDFESAAKLVTQKTKAFLSVNYFGFPQPFEKIREFCKQNGLFFIEDNAHSFLSQRDGEYLGTYGDISILSFRKLIPLVNGAALLINTDNNDCFNSIKNKAKKLMEEKGFVKKLKSSVQRFCRTNNFDLSKIKKRSMQIPEAGSTENEELPYKINNSVLKLLSKYDLGREAKRRRAKYVKILNMVDKRFIPIFNRLPEGVVPNGCPFYVKERDKWLSFFTSTNLHIYTWPTLPKAVVESGKKATQIWSKVLVFPV